MIYDSTLETANRKMTRSFELSCLNLAPDGDTLFTEDIWADYDESVLLLPRSRTYTSDPTYFYRIQHLDASRLIYRGPETK